MIEFGNRHSDGLLVAAQRVDRVVQTTVAQCLQRLFLEDLQQRVDGTFDPRLLELFGRHRDGEPFDRVTGRPHET